MKKLSNLIYYIGIQNQHLYISIHAYCIYMNRVYTMKICLKVDRGEVKIWSFFVVFFFLEKIKKHKKSNWCWWCAAINSSFDRPALYSCSMQYRIYIQTINIFFYIPSTGCCFSSAVSKKGPKKKEQKPKAVVVYTYKGASPWLAADGIAIHHTQVLR